MHKHVDYWPHRAWEPPFGGLFTPTFGIAETIVATFGSLGKFFAKKHESWRRRRLIARTVAELSSLDDHTLRDIGIPRGEVYAAALSAVEDPKGGYRRCADF